MTSIRMSIFVVYLSHRKKSKNDPAVSANVAYGQVKLEIERDREKGGEYENLDQLARSGCDQGNPAPYEFPDSKTEALPVYEITVHASGRTQP